MSGATVELIERGVHALRRSSTWWAIGIVGFVVLNAAFWPALEGTETLQSMENMGTVLEAFGAQNIALPAGYLDGQVFALLLPLLLSGMAIAGITAVTSGDEDAGRLELLHALPVSRTTVWLTRWVSFTATLAAVAVVIGLATAVAVRVFSFDGVGVGRVFLAVFACALLAAFHVSVAFAAGALGGSRGRAVGAAVLVTMLGYVVSFVFPLADSLRGARRWSPWYWAIGQQPVSDGVSLGRLLLLAAFTAALVWAGSAAVNRRDIRTA